MLFLLMNSSFSYNHFIILPFSDLEVGNSKIAQQRKTKQRMSKSEFGKAVSIFEPRRTKSRKKKNFNKENVFSVGRGFYFPLQQMAKCL